MMGSINYVTTIINLRTPGMTFNRLPLTIWALLITAILQAFALPVLTVALILQLLDKTLGTTFSCRTPAWRSATKGRASAVDNRCCGSTCSGSTRTRRSTS